MHSPPSGQASLLEDRGPEQGPRRLVTRLDVELAERRAHDLALTLGMIGYRDVADAIRAALEDLPPA